MTHNGRNLEAFLRDIFPVKKGSEPSAVSTEKSCAFAIILEEKTKQPKTNDPPTQTENKPPTNKHQTKKP